jgi:serine/threonine-protein kinase
MASDPPPGPSPIQPGFRLDRYELLCVLAQGGMASVWLARLQGKHGFEKLVAVKTILPNFAADKNFHQMFLDEARITSGIEHPNVVQILDLGEYHETLYIVMELVDGDPLQKLHRTLEKKGMRIPLPIALKIMSDCSAGLHAAHELCGPDGSPQNVVHRDVSPQNMLVTTTGSTKVIDFGIAKARDRGTGETAAGTLKGKVQFMAREQALNTDVDRRADTWAVGAVLYYLIAGVAPYEQASQLATLNALMNSAAVPPLPPDVPTPIVSVIMKSLHHDKARRFQTALEMQQALDQAAHYASLVASSAQVAAFLAEHLRGRAEGRKQLIERALKEAAHRATQLPLLRSPPELQTTASGRGPQVTVKMSPQQRATSPLAATMFDPNQRAPEIPDLRTSGTLGSQEVQIPDKPPMSRAPIVAAIMAGVTLAAAGAASLLVFKHKNQPADVPAAATTAAATVAVPAATGARAADPIPPPPPVASVAAQEQDAGAAQAPTNAVANAGGNTGVAPIAKRPAFTPVSKPSPSPQQPATPAKPSAKKDDYGF